MNDKRMHIMFDLDDTLIRTVNHDYMGATPIMDRIEHVNDLYDSGHILTINTARGAVSGKDWYEQTKSQLEGFGLKFHRLLVGEKKHYDLQICDKTVNSELYFQLIKLYNNPDQRAIDRWDDEVKSRM